METEAGGAGTRTVGGPASPLVYVHVPKAAGTSLKDVIARVYRGRRALFFLPRTGELERFRALPAGVRGRFAVVAGHEPYGLHEVFDGCGVRPWVITVLRSPAARVASLFGYIHREPAHPLHAEFVGGNVTIGDVYDRFDAVAFDNHQVRYLAGAAAHAKPFGGLTEDDLRAAQTNLSSGLAAFGLQERFGESLSWFERVLGWPRTPAGKLNTSPGGVGFEGSARRLVLERNALDVALYEYAVGLFEERARG